MMKINFENHEYVYYIINEDNKFIIREGLVIKTPNELDTDDTSVELLIRRVDNKFIYATYDYMKVQMYSSLDELIKDKLNVLDDKSKNLYKKMLNNE